MCKNCGCPAGGNEQLEMRIEGIVDGDCAAQVKALLMRLPGVLHVEILSTQGMCNVDFDPHRTMEAKIRQTVSNAGYNILGAAIKHNHHRHHHH